MNSLVIVVVAFAGYLIAYRTYGKFLATRIFRIDPNAVAPSVAQRDDVDFVPTDRHILFGHHYTSIAGLGPIVGPAIGVIWGWLPAMLWVVFGCIFMGAVHDFGALVLSMRSKGRSIGDLAGEIVNGRVRTIFLLVIFFVLVLVIAVFALIIASLFSMVDYEGAVLPVWLEIPIALVLGYLIYKKGFNHLILGIAAVVLMYVTVVIGTYVPIEMPSIFGIPPLAIWVVILLTYAYIASTLPVQWLLQPRDYINSHQLVVAMGLLCLGTVLAHPEVVAPAVDLSPEGAPPIWPILFVTIACGAISGFHSLVASGTSSKQCDAESSARFIGYGGMLTEGALATLVIVALTAGLGMGVLTDDGTLQGSAAFEHHYANWGAAKGLSAKLDAFVKGSANMIACIGIPAKITITVMAVFLVSFAATTMDSATRIQRYVVAELGRGWRIKPLTDKHVATTVAVVTAGLLAFHDGEGKGALTLWPLFGAVNQLLAALALLVLTIYLARRGTKIRYTAIPFVLMVILTTWAMVYNIVQFLGVDNWLLLGLSVIILALEMWMIVESAVVFRSVYGRTPANPDATAS